MCRKAIAPKRSTVFNLWSLLSTTTLECVLVVLRAFAVVASARADVQSLAVRIQAVI